MSDKPEAIRPGSTWVSKETGLSVEIVSVKDGAVFWESERVGFLGTLQTTEGAFRNAMRPASDAFQSALRSGERSDVTTDPDGRMKGGSNA